MLEICTRNITGSDAVYWRADHPQGVHVAIEHDNKQSWYATVYPTKDAFEHRTHHVGYRRCGFRSQAVTWAMQQLGQDALHVAYLVPEGSYLCGVPLCGRAATQRVHFYSDTPMLIRGMSAVGEAGQHEDFCEQCYSQAGFTAESDITVIPVCDIDAPEPDYGCDCSDCLVTDCTGQCWAGEF